MAKKDIYKMTLEELEAEHAQLHEELGRPKAERLIAVDMRLKHLRGQKGFEERMKMHPSITKKQQEALWRQPTSAELKGTARSPLRRRL